SGRYRETFPRRFFRCLLLGCESCPPLASQTAPPARWASAPRQNRSSPPGPSRNAALDRSARCNWSRYALHQFVCDGKAAAGLGLSNCGAGEGGHVRERPVGVITEQHARLFVGAAQLMPVHLGIDVAIDQQKVGPAIVIEVKELRPPPQKLGVQTEAGGEGHVRECPVAG